MTYLRFPSRYYQPLSRFSNSVFLETSRFDPENYQRFLFIEPVQILQLHSISKIPELFSRIEAALASGYYVAGFLNDACGHYFQELPSDIIGAPPLAWFGVYSEPFIFNHCTGTSDLEKLLSEKSAPTPPNPAIEALQFNLSEAAYCQKMKRINAAKDKQLCRVLQQDEKNRAENLMIVDLLRNDLGRLAVSGSVEVTALFRIEAYHTFFQMISTIRARLMTDISYFDIFKALYPCGSVTGAPKIRSMEIIQELKPQPRGVYSSAIGYISPHQKAVFNAAIRTVVIQGEHGEMGSGGGVVWDSRPREEYKECQLKAAFLKNAAALLSPEIIETMLWNGEYRFLEMHLKRLQASAAFFDYPLRKQALIAALQQNARQLDPQSHYKVRLLLAKDSTFSLENIPLDITRAPLSGPVALSEIPTDSTDYFYYHKTTCRTLYNQMYHQAAREGFLDILFRNEKNQITEGAVSNIFIRTGDHYLTPPPDCGLLNGIYRQHLLATLPNAKEAILMLEDLQQADAIFICNAIHGLRMVYLQELPANSIS